MAAVFWVALGQTALGFYQIGGWPVAFLFGMMLIAALSGLWKEAGTRLNPPRGRLWTAWLFVLPWLLVIAWAQFVTPQDSTGLLGLLAMFFGGSSEAPALLRAARAVHIGVGVALLGWSFIELVAAGRRGRPNTSPGGSP
jgi:hypothetical protein